MPTYLNSTDTTILVDNPATTLAPGDNALDCYLKSLPTGVTLKSHTPAVKPWVLISVEEDGTYIVSDYDNIAIYNASDDAASISANTDDSNAYFIASLAKEIFSNEKRLFGCLKVLSKGSGNVHIYGVK